MEFFVIAIFSVVLMLMLIRALKYGALSPLFLWLTFMFIGVLFRAWQLVLESGPYIVLAPWVLKTGLSSAVTLALLELFFVLIIAFVFSSSYSIKKSSSRRMKIPKILLAQELTYIQNYFLAIIGSVAFFVFLILMSNHLGGLANVIMILQSRSVASLAGTGYITLLTDITIVSTLLLSFSFYKKKTLPARFQGKWVFYGMLVLSLVMLIALGGRGAIVQLLLMIVIVYYACEKRRVRLSGKLLNIILFTFLVVIVGVVLRHSAQTQDSLSNSSAVVLEDFGAAVSAPFALIDHYMLAKAYVDINGYDYGAQYLTYPLRPIPRSLWEDKPIAIALQLRQEFWGDNEGGIPPTIFGEFFISFGYFGLLIGSVFIGLVLRWLGHLYDCSFSESKGAVLYSLLVVTMVFSVTRSGLEIAVVKIIIYPAILACLNMALKLRIGNTSGNRGEM